MEYEIGTKIKSCEITFEVKEAENGCQGCYFYYKDIHECLDCYKSLGECGSMQRTDDKDVIFVQTKES